MSEIILKLAASWNESESESRSVVSDSLQRHGLYSPWNSPGQNTGAGCHALLQGIFSTQELNPGLLHCRHILYHLNHQGSSRILEWVAYPSPGELPDTGIELGSPALQADSLPAELLGKHLFLLPTHESSPHSVIIAFTELIPILELF